MQQYSIDVQRELPFGVAMEVGYVGSHSTHLTQATANININALNPSLLSQGSALTATVANPFFNKGGAGVIGAATREPGAVAAALPHVQHDQPAVQRLQLCAASTLPIASAISSCWRACCSGVSSLA